MIIIGLTGSIGMGKSTIASMLRRNKIPVHEADDEVHALLASKGKAVRAVSQAFPFLLYPHIYGQKKGVRIIKRIELAKIIFEDEKARKKLERILHPLVRQSQNDFIRQAKKSGKKIVALDIPLLFETGGDNFVDVVLVASAPYKIQRARVLERAGMSERKFRAILKTQMPDGEKRARADYIIHTGLGHAHAMKQVKTVLRDIKKTMVS